MTPNLFFTDKQQKLTANIKWLIVVCFLIRAILFFTPFISPELGDSRTFINSNFFVLTTAVWGSYFLARKKWLPFIVIAVFVFVDLLFKNDIKISLDYYLSYVLDKNTETIVTWTDRFFTIGYFLLIPLLYGKAEGIKGRKAWLYTFLIGIVTIVTMDNANLGILERMDITGTWREVLYYLALTILYTIKDIAFLLAFLHLLFRVKEKQHLLRMPAGVEMNRKQFLPAFFVSYSVFIFSALTLVYTFLKMSFSYFFNSNWFIYIEGVCIALPVLASAYFIGNAIERRNEFLGNYYGFFAFISWVPVINIVGYLVMAFVEMKNLVKARPHELFGKQRLVHTIASCLFILALCLWMYRDKASYSDAVYYTILYSIVTFVLAYFKRRVLLMAVLASCYYIISNVIELSNYYTDTSIWKLLGDKMEIETLLLVSFYSIIHYGLFFIVHKALYRETTLAESFPEEPALV
jgi:hypothetical protein